MSNVRIENLSKNFHALRVLEKINLRVQSGEFVVIFGPNACGKSTLLNLIAGLEPLSAGQIRIDEKPPQEAKIGMVFQNFHETLFPWRSVTDNIGFSLEVQGHSKAGARKKARIFVESIGLGEFAEKFPHQLSGGMKQLVSIARAWAFDPEIFVLDEPFSALDYQNRILAEEFLQSVWQKTKKTTILVSHDVEEAVFLADKIIVLSRRPAKIKKIIPVNLARPRTFETRLKKGFFELKKRVLREFNTDLGNKKIAV